MNKHMYKLNLYLKIYIPNISLPYKINLFLFIKQNYFKDYYNKLK